MEFKKDSLSVFRSPLSFVFDSCLTLFYPQPCKICGKSVETRACGFVCEECWQNTYIFKDKEIICQKCGAFLKKGISDAETFCRRCETDEYDAARSVGLYEKALAASILTLKTEPFLAAHLRNLIISSFANSHFQDTTRIIPVPLSKQRFAERGFNQASIIASVIGKNFDLPVDEITLARTIHTEKHRAGMDRKARAESIRNAFEVKRPRLVENADILLVDDVFTSGATVSNCAKSLKKNGVRKVYVFTIARAF